MDYRNIDNPADDSVIVINAITCPCENAELIVSVHRHDYNSCSCGKYAVDGGNDYLKRSFPKDANYIEESIAKKRGGPFFKVGRGAAPKPKLYRPESTVIIKDISFTITVPPVDLSFPVSEKDFIELIKSTSVSVSPTDALKEWDKELYEDMQIDTYLCHLTVTGRTVAIHYNKTGPLFNKVKSYMIKYRRDEDLNEPGILEPIEQLFTPIIKRNPNLAKFYFKP